MEPISLAASIIALFQASDRLIQSIHYIRQLSLASEEIEALAKDILRLKEVLLIVSEAQNADRKRYATTLVGLIEDCEESVRELELMISSLARGERSGRSSSISSLARVRWMRRRTRAQSLRQGLRDSVSSLTLYMTAMQIHKNGISTIDALKYDKNEVSVSEYVAGIFHSAYTLKSRRPMRPDKAHAIIDGAIDATSLEIRPELATESYDDELSIHPQYGSKDHGKTTQHYVANTTYEHGNDLLGQNYSVLLKNTCAGACRCQCHQRLVWFLPLANGYLGWVFVNQLGTFKPCDNHCQARSIPSLTILYIGPIWCSKASLCLTFTYPGRPIVSLSFPRIMQPDTEFFNCIRRGDCNRIKQLLSSGEASMADIVAPYGISILQLALLWGQGMVVQFLVTAGVAQNLAHYNWTFQAVLDYFSWCSFAQSNLFPSTVIQDYVRLMAPSSPIDDLCAISEINHEVPQFSRLHRCILSLSCEDLSSNIQNWKSVIDEVDSCNRTALYWASKQLLLDKMKTLILYGADPEIPDYNGSTPLHVSAGRGHVEGISLLIKHGARLESTDRFGATPLHHACAHGNVSAISMLLDLGANPEAINHVGETALFKTNHAGHIAAGKYMMERGVNTGHRDSWGFNPLIDAVFVNAHEALELLLGMQEQDMGIRICGGRTLLHIAALNADLRTIELLLNGEIWGLDSYEVDEEGVTALEYLRQRKDCQDVLEAFGALLVKIQGRERSFGSVNDGKDEFHDALEVIG